MKLTIALALAGATMLAPLTIRYASAIRANAQRMQSQDAERRAAIELCAQQDASAFQHLQSGRFFCVGGSRRVSSPLSNPLESP